MLSVCLTELGIRSHSNNFSTATKNASSISELGESYEIITIFIIKLNNKRFI